MESSGRDVTSGGKGRGEGVDSEELVLAIQGQEEGSLWGWTLLYPACGGGCTNLHMQ